MQINWPQNDCFLFPLSLSFLMIETHCIRKGKTIKIHLRYGSLDYVSMTNKSLSEFRIYFSSDFIKKKKNSLRTHVKPMSNERKKRKKKTSHIDNTLLDHSFSFFTFNIDDDVVI
ncbi:hypothetical protein NH340_JMT04851 [Sarcoptes scabiei]|nr:hypothetical protein NH340_JMT04851 [Sarcoptes scabiei]